MQHTIGDGIIRDLSTGTETKSQWRLQDEVTHGLGADRLTLTVIRPTITVPYSPLQYHPRIVPPLVTLAGMWSINCLPVDVQS